jgi:hypothetical protein
MLPPTFFHTPLIFSKIKLVSASLIFHSLI